MSGPLIGRKSVTIEFRDGIPVMVETREALAREIQSHHTEFGGVEWYAGGVGSLGSAVHLVRVYNIFQPGERSYNSWYRCRDAKDAAEVFHDLIGHPPVSRAAI